MRGGMRVPKAADHTTRQEALRELRQALARLLDVTERQRTLTGRLEQDVACLRAELRQAGDLHVVACSTREGTSARLVYLEGGADPRLVAAARQALAAWGDAGAPVLKEVSSPETACVELLQGHALLLLDRRPKAFVLATSAEPKAETTESERV